MAGPGSPFGEAPWRKRHSRGIGCRWPAACRIQAAGHGSFQGRGHPRARSDPQAPSRQCWSSEEGLNLRPYDYRSHALPTELPDDVFLALMAVEDPPSAKRRGGELVDPAGLEPATSCLQGRRSPR